MQEFQDDLYAILGVEEAASADEIRKAYLKLAKKLHPDRFPNDPEKRAQAQADFSKVTRAHDILADAKQRDEYDALRKLAKTRGGLGQAATEPSAQTNASGGSAGAPAGQKPVDRDQWASKHQERALDLLKRRKYPEADTAIKEAIRLNPNNASYHATLAEIHLQRGWKTLAMTSVNQALKIDPKNYEAKDVELKLKASAGKQTSEHGKPGADGAGKKGGILDQLKSLLNKKM